MLKTFIVRPRLAEILKERGLTQAQLQEISGVPQTTISRFDKATSHSDVHLFAIAHALELKIEDLFETIVDEEVEQWLKDQAE